VCRSKRPRVWSPVFAVFVVVGIVVELIFINVFFISIIPRPRWTPAVFLIRFAALAVAVAGHSVLVLGSTFVVVVPIRRLVRTSLALGSALSARTFLGLSIGKIVVADRRTFTANVSKRDKELSKAKTVQIFTLNLHVSDKSRKLWVAFSNSREFVNRAPRNLSRELASSVAVFPDAGVDIRLGLCGRGEQARNGLGISFEKEKRTSTRVEKLHFLQVG